MSNHGFPGQLARYGLVAWGLKAGLQELITELSEACGLRARRLGPGAAHGQSTPVTIETPALGHEWKTAIGNNNGHNKTGCNANFAVCGYNFDLIAPNGIPLSF